MTLGSAIAVVVLAIVCLLSEGNVCRLSWLVDCRWKGILGVSICASVGFSFWVWVDAGLLGVKARVRGVRGRKGDWHTTSASQRCGEVFLGSICALFGWMTASNLGLVRSIGFRLLVRWGGNALVEGS